MFQELDFGFFPDFEGLELCVDDFEFFCVVVALPVEFLVSEHFVFEFDVELADLAAQVVHDGCFVGGVGVSAEETGRLDVAGVGDEVVADGR